MTVKKMKSNTTHNYSAWVLFYYIFIPPLRWTLKIVSPPFLEYMYPTLVPSDKARMTWILFWLCMLCFRLADEWRTNHSHRKVQWFHINLYVLIDQRSTKSQDLAHFYFCFVTKMTKSPMVHPVWKFYEEISSSLKVSSTISCLLRSNLFRAKWIM